MRNKGSILVILITLVIIIGILAILLWPMVPARSLKAKIAVTKANISIIGQALNLYQRENGFFPTIAQGLDALISVPTTSPLPPNWDGPYLGKLSLDRWGNPYQYRCPSTHGKLYDIWSWGPDGKDGTADDIVSW